MELEATRGQVKSLIDVERQAPTNSGLQAQVATPRPKYAYHATTTQWLLMVPM